MSPMNYYSYLKMIHATAMDGESDVPIEKCRAPGGPSSCSVHGPKLKSELAKEDSETPSKVSPEEDAAYVDAVKRGDMAEAMRMVRDAAARSMPNTKVVGEDGLPLAVWHGGNFATEGNFEADLSCGEMHFGTRKAAEERVDYKYAALKAEDPYAFKKSVSVKPYFLNLENPKEVEDNDGSSSTWLDYSNDEDRKHDGIVYENESEDKGSKSYGVSWDKAKIKLADPVTYDDNGNVIPLSKRFDMTNPDIRY